MYSKRSCFIHCMVVIFFLNSFPGFAQEYTLQLRIKSIPSSHLGDTIYVAGNFNEWNPGNEKYQLIKTDSIYTINIPALKQDAYELKFTRGNWSKGEVRSDGSGVNNRVVKLTSDS